MPWLRIFGQTMPISRAQNSIDIGLGGKLERAFDGRLINTRVKDRYEFRYTLQPHLGLARTTFYEALISGDYSYASMDDGSWTHDGLPITTDGSITLFDAKHGAAKLRLTSGQTAVIAPPRLGALGAGWLAFCWISQDGGTYQHHALSSDGTKYINGLSTASAICLTESAGALTISNLSGNNDNIDDFVVLYASVPTANVADIHDDWHSENPWNRYLQVSGDHWSRDAAVSCQGLYGGSKARTAVVDGVMDSNAQSGTFSLLSVDEIAPTPVFSDVLNPPGFGSSLLLWYDAAQPGASSQPDDLGTEGAGEMTTTVGGGSLLTLDGSAGPSGGPAWTCDGSQGVKYASGTYSFEDDLDHTQWFIAEGWSNTVVNNRGQCYHGGASLGQPWWYNNGGVQKINGFTQNQHTIGTIGQVHWAVVVVQIDSSGNYRTAVVTESTDHGWTSLSTNAAGNGLRKTFTGFGARYNGNFKFTGAIAEAGVNSGQVDYATIVDYAKEKYPGVFA